MPVAPDLDEGDVPQRRAPQDGAARLLDDLNIIIYNSYGDANIMPGVIDQISWSESIFESLGLEGKNCPAANALAHESTRGPEGRQWAWHLVSDAAAQVNDDDRHSPTRFIKIHG
jgi:hypothetical protein